MIGFLRYACLFLAVIFASQALSFVSTTAPIYEYDADESLCIGQNIECEVRKQNYDERQNLLGSAIYLWTESTDEKYRLGHFYPFEDDFFATKSAAGLSKSQLKGIKSFEKQIQKHQQKLDDFKANPTVRPGMENLSKGVIKRQQGARIKHLETEISTFKNNIEKIKIEGL